MASQSLRRLVFAGLTKAYLASLPSESVILIRLAVVEAFCYIFAA